MYFIVTVGIITTDLLCGDFLVIKTSKVIKNTDKVNNTDTENRFKSRKTPQHKKSSKEWE